MTNIKLKAYKPPVSRAKTSFKRISTEFEVSKKYKLIIPKENIPAKDPDRIFRNSKVSKIPYGPTTTLGKAGCAVFVIHQGLRLNRNTEINIADLAAQIAELGYYCARKGTYHVLFDNLRCKRARSVQQMIDYLSTPEKPVATLLVKNPIYFGRDTGRHFINAVGITNFGFIIDDSECASRQTISYEKIVAACEGAWLW